MKIDFDNSVLQHFLKNPGNKFHFNELVVGIPCNPKLLSANLKKFVEVGIVNSIKETNRNLFWLKDTELTKSIKKAWILLALKKYLSKLDFSNVAKIFLYGSFSNQTYTKTSDLDLLVTFYDKIEYNVDVIRELEDYLGKEVSFIIYKDKDFFRLVKDNNKFANNVFKKGIKLYDSIEDNKLLI